MLFFALQVKNAVSEEEVGGRGHQMIALPALLNNLRWEVDLHWDGLLLVFNSLFP